MRSKGLGHIIDRLRAADPAKVCRIGFHRPHSYRGYYEDLAFVPVENISVAAMLAAAESADGETYDGWKGGEYKMSEWTQCWLSERGESGNDAIGPVMMSLILDEPMWKAEKMIGDASEPLKAVEHQWLFREPCCDEER